MKVKINALSVQKMIMRKIIFMNISSGGLTIKCFVNDCKEFFHPICMRECLSYFNFTAVENTTYVVIFCEEHSKKYIINSFNNILFKEK